MDSIWNQKKTVRLHYEEVESIWTPPGLHIESGGVHMESTWTPHRIWWSPHGVHLESGKVLGFVYVGNDLASGAERTLHSTQPNHKTNNLTRHSLVCESRGDRDEYALQLSCRDRNEYALQLSRYHDGIALQLLCGHDGRTLHFTETHVKL
ncbi:hypothetical protein BDZ97DRAFT_1758231 [Flammula alnicola]|nr:hypothetical protein BDZ97DRAFT_1765847 [Flammula alnicola]KAF8964144.1 hypothetical protein BDZ97DRAFT_1758231 [Flammula alnicola]